MNRRRRVQLVLVVAAAGLAGLACEGSLDTWVGKAGDGGPGDDPPADSGGGPLGVSCPAIPCPAGESCVDGSCVAEDPCATVVCHGAGEVCSAGVCVAGESDNDGDGYRAREDCDDRSPTVFPGAPESCNGLDDDCDDDRDEDFDADGDGATTCGGGVAERADCDDADPMVFPGAAETCNGVDDDCDGTVDVSPVDAGMPCGGSGGVCRPGTTACRSGELVCDGGVGPSPETCDGLDNDCDGAVDNGIGDRSCTGRCGAGTERCVSGGWVCDAPSSGECDPGATEQEPCDCGFRTRTCGSSCTWSGWGGCSGGPCGAGASCCSGACRLDVNNCGDCGLACPSGYRAACCTDAWGTPGCCPDGYPICGGDGYCYY